MKSKKSKRSNLAIFVILIPILFVALLYGVHIFGGNITNILELTLEGIGIFVIIAVLVLICNKLSNNEKTNNSPLSSTAIECPYCHSTNTHKLSTISRGTSTLMFGLASSKIGKQWHCNKCGSDF